MGGRPGAFMSNFAGIKSLRLGLNYDVFYQYCWAFLEKESARDLRLIKFTGHSPENKNSAVKWLISDCATLPHLLGPLELDFIENGFSGEFIMRVIEMLMDPIAMWTPYSERELSIQMKTLRDDELVLDERDYKVDVDAVAKRYTSEK